MLKDFSSSAILAVSDLPRARRFYEDVLGLEPRQADDHVVEYATGHTALVIYVSEFAGTNRGNAVVWGVGEAIDGIVAELHAKGAPFEQYDLDGANYRDGMHVQGAMKLAWLKDPDGNILHINNM